MKTSRRIRVALVLFCAGPTLAAQVLFAPPHTMPMDDDVLSALAAGDLNGDGFADLAQCNGLFLPPSVRLGDGAGNFGRAVAVDQPVAGTAVALADVTGDGLLDLLVGQTAPAARLNVLPGAGDGTFGAAVVYATMGAPSLTIYRIHAGDADDDGDTDVLSVAGGVGGFLGEVRLLRNDGAGALQAQIVASPAGLLMDDARAADVNGDGRADLLLFGAIAGPTYQTRVLLGNVSGGFDAAATLPAGPLIDVADLDDDGVLDLVAQDAGPDSDVRVLLGAGDGTFTTGPLADISVHFDHTFAVADFDGDGAPDLLYGAAFPAEGHVMTGAGDGSFGPAELVLSFPPHTNAWYRLVADFDGDGRSDLASLLKDNTFTSLPDVMMVAFNRTYAAGGPLLDLGHSLEGSHGWPIQVASGTFVPGLPFAFSISGAPPSGALAEYVGVSALMAPFKGGVFVPSPDLRVGLAADAHGAALLAGNWPAGLPSGLQLFMQAWFKDTAGPHGFGSTSGLRLTLP